jgi:hypothetical protein
MRRRPYDADVCAHRERGVPWQLVASVSMPARSPGLLAPSRADFLRREEFSHLGRVWNVRSRSASSHWQRVASGTRRDSELARVTAGTIGTVDQIKAEHGQPKLRTFAPVERDQTIDRLVAVMFSVLSDKQREQASKLLAGVA